MNNLYQLVYISFISPNFDETCIPEIVRRAREKNLRSEVTGLLVFDGLCFVQYLEGPDTTLYSLLETIRKDPRHIELAVKEQGRVSGSRLFADQPLTYALSRRADALDQFHHIAKTGRSPIVLLMQLLPTFEIVRARDD